MAEDKRRCYCSECGKELPDQAWLPPEEQTPCGDCGSTLKTFMIELAPDNLELRELIQGKAKSPIGERAGLSGRRTFREWKDGQVPRRDTPEGWAHEVWVADREHDQWDHTVTAPDGTVLHDEHPRLSEHRSNMKNPSDPRDCNGPAEE